jgi:hypothetical protein
MPGGLVWRASLQWQAGDLATASGTKRNTRFYFLELLPRFSLDLFSSRLFAGNGSLYTL